MCPVHKIGFIFPLSKPEFRFGVQKKRTRIFWSVSATTNMGFRGFSWKNETEKSVRDVIKSGVLMNPVQMQKFQNACLMRVLTALNTRYCVLLSLTKLIGSEFKSVHLIVVLLSSPVMSCDACGLHPDIYRLDYLARSVILLWAA